MKRFYKVLFILAFAILLSFGGSTKAHADWNNDAIDYYNKYGESSARLIDGKFWFCQRGRQAASGTRYRPVGFEVSVNIGGTFYSFSTNIGGSYIKTISSRSSGGYLYDLWAIDYNVVANRLSEVHPGKSFTDFANKAYNTQARFYAYVALVDDYGVYGGIDSNGSKWGTLYHEKYNKPFTWIPQEEWSALFVDTTIMSAQKPAYPKINTSRIYIPDNAAATHDYIHQPSDNLVYVRTGKTLPLRFDATLSYEIKNYGMNALFWDTTDYYNNDSGTIAMHSSLSTSTSNTNFFYIGASFTQRLSSSYSTILKRHNNTLVTGNLNYVMDTEEHYNLFPRVMTFFDNNYSTSNFQPRIDSDTRQDSSKKMTVISDGTAPTYTSHEIKNITTSGFDVYVYGVTDNSSGVKSIKIPVWTKSDQSDIVWYEASNQGSGTYKVTVSASKHNNSKGPYTIHMHAYDNVSNLKMYNLDSVSLDFPITSDVDIVGYEYKDPATGKIWVQTNNKFDVNGTYSGKTVTGNRIDLVVITSYKLNSAGTAVTYSPVDHSVTTSMSNNTRYYNAVYGNGGQQVSSFMFDSKTSYLLKVDNTNYKTYTNTWFTADEDFEFNALTRVVNSSNQAVAGTGYRDQRILVSSDGNAPTGSGFSSTYTTSSDSVSLTVNTVSDTRSGVNTSSVYAKIYPNGSSSKAVKVALTKGSSGYVASTNLSSLDFTEYSGYTVEYYASDNVGNEGKIGTSTFTRSNPVPLSNSIEIKNYEYKDVNTGIKWVQAGNEFTIYQLGSGVSHQPTHMYAYLYSKDYATHNATFTSSKSYNAIDVNHNEGFTKTKAFTAKDYSALSNGIASTYYLSASSVLNGNVYRLKHQAQYKSGTTDAWSANNQSSEYLGIDAVGPTVSWGQSGRNQIIISMKDNESGLSSVTVTLSNGSKKTVSLKGNSQSITVDLETSTLTSIVVTDNVGNSSTASVSDIRTRVESTITTQSVLTGGRKKLKVTVTAKVVNPIPQKTMTLRIKATGDGVPTNSEGVVKDLYVSDSNQVTYTFYVDDIYNTTSKPGLTYSTSNTEAGITVGNLSDITKNYTFTLESRYELLEDTWQRENNVTGNFASGFDHYKYSLYKLTDSDFKALSSPLEIANNKKVSNKFVSMKYLPTGTYKIRVTMYDYNGNPSGVAELTFDHNQPSEYGQLQLNVTAVKDVDWKSASYPFNYERDASKFPLGSSFRFNNNPINLGYALNFNIELLNNIPITSYEVKYDIYGKDSSGNRVELKTTLDGKDLSYYDNNESTNYLSQTSDFTVKDNKMYLKHYLPASLVVKKADGSAYSGNIYVDAKFAGYINPTFDIGQLSGTYNLYSVITSETAIDDLELDKQR